MNKSLTHYNFLSNQALSLPTELLQVGFFRNTPQQNAETIKHNLSTQQYELNGLYCDTFVETPLFSMMLVEHHNYYLQPNNADAENDEAIILSLNKGSKIFKQLKMKGNYTIAQLLEKLNKFISKFKDRYFYVDEEPIHVFVELFINPHDNTLRFEFSEDFIDYLNKRKHSLTLIQNSDFVAIKRKIQTPLFLIVQSLKGLNKPFFTKSYITNILGIKGDMNKKLSVAFNHLKEKHVLEYEKEVCHRPGISTPFSRFNIQKVDSDFVTKIQIDKSQKAQASSSKPTSNKTNKINKPEVKETKTTSNSPISNIDKPSDAVSFEEEKNKRTADIEKFIDLGIDELDEAFILGVSGGDLVAYRTENGGVGAGFKSQLPQNTLIFTPELMARTKIKILAL